MKNFNLLTVGIGGEGVLTAGVVVARAAHLEKKYVMGLQLHGLSQRGGSIPVFVRFGDVHAPTIPRGQADIIIASEPSEALRFAKYGSKERTVFIIDNNPVKSSYSNVLNEHYPAKEEIIAGLKPFAKKVYYVDASKKCEKLLGNQIYGNVCVLGIAVSRGLLPLNKKNIVESIKQSVRHDTEKNLAAFELGINMEKK